MPARPTTATGSRPSPPTGPALHRRSPAGERATTRSGVQTGARQASDGQTISAVARNAGDARNAASPPSPTAIGSRAERPQGSHRAGGGRSGAGGARQRSWRGGGRQWEHELTLEELLEETGVEIEAAVRELEGFALITPKVIGGSRYYSREAAVVARLASAFARHGVEARHFRGYKGAADREAGLIEQVIMPLIRQRNPEARQSAAEAVEELSNLGGELRAALLRSALADLH